MADKLVLGYESVQVNNTMSIGKELYMPILANITTPPSDQTKPAFGQYNGHYYGWNTVSLAWEPAGSGSDSTNWSSGNTFSS